VRDLVVIEAALLRFRTWCEGNGYEVAGQAASELAGAEGNQEFFFYLMPT
jgi:predicted rRNA methylase YqxC with S4 and FtsJ domains